MKIAFGIGKKTILYFDEQREAFGCFELQSLKLLKTLNSFRRVSQDQPTDARLWFQTDTFSYFDIYMA